MSYKYMSFIHFGLTICSTSRDIKKSTMLYDQASWSGSSEGYLIFLKEIHMDTFSKILVEKGSHIKTIVFVRQSSRLKLSWSYFISTYSMKNICLASKIAQQQILHYLCCFYSFIQREYSWKWLLPRIIPKFHHSWRSQWGQIYSQLNNVLV